jgi:signal transduction histidine kinase
MKPSKTNPRAESLLRARTQMLIERRKELRCLVRISRLVGDQGQPLERLLADAVRVLPAALRYPSQAWARLTLAAQVHQTARAKRTPWRLTAKVRTRLAGEGRLEIGYLSQHAFLPEERELLRAVAVRIADLADLKTFEASLLAHRTRLRSLAAELTRAEQRERRQLALDLHDRVGQSLAVAKLRIESMRADLQRAHDGASLTESLGALSDLIQALIEDTRSLVFEISPPILYELGLGPALRWLAERLSWRAGIAVQVHIEPDAHASPELEEELRAFLFRAAHELLTNAIKHAHASELRIALGRTGGRACLCVEDDGVGFAVPPEGPPPAMSGLGLFSLRERLEHLGGSLRLESAPGRGTRVRIEAPVALPEQGGAP